MFKYNVNILISTHKGREKVSHPEIGQFVDDDEREGDSGTQDNKDPDADHCNHGVLYK